MYMPKKNSQAQKSMCSPKTELTKTITSAPFGGLGELLNAIQKPESLI